MIYWFLSILLLGSFPKAEKEVVNPVPVEDTLSVRILNYDQLKSLLHNDSDTTYLVNFWATWCSPCVQELPYLVSLDSILKGSPFRLILVSLDFKKDYLRKLEPFVRERGLEPYVVVLEDNRANYWIDDIDPSWSGAIPATLVYKGDQRAFFEHSFHHTDEIKDIIKPFLNL
jgi:thiol-disulfide isomerase/thioredoxin